VTSTLAELTATTTWFPVLTLLIGYATASLTDWIQNKRAIARERQTREATRHDQRVASRITFQRETLLELQEVAMQLGRATARAHHLDEMAYRQSTQWRNSLLPDDLDEALRVAQARTLLLAVRVRDDTVRTLVEEFKSNTSATLLAADRDVASRAMAASAGLHDHLQRRIGELLREIDSSDD
jgi:hypothetical protein